MLSPAPEWGPALDKHRTGPYKGTSAETNGVAPPNVDAPPTVRVDDIDTTYTNKAYEGPNSNHI